MRSLNGTTFEAQLFIKLEFTAEDADQFLAARSEDRTKVLNDICARKHPLPEISSFNADSFRKSVGEALANRREAELKQLTEGTAP